MLIETNFEAEFFLSLLWCNRLGLRDNVEAQQHLPRQQLFHEEKKPYHLIFRIVHQSHDLFTKARSKNAY
jgi:hypothetical protein